MKQSDSDSASTNTSSRRQKKSVVSSPKDVGEKTILWSEWWPFTRATGDALRQLNRPQKKEYYPLDAEEAPI
jgi:hypothetical protein